MPDCICFRGSFFLLVCFIAGKHTQINTRVPNLVEHCLQYRWCFPCCSSMFQVFHCSMFLWGLFQTAVNPYGSWTAFISISTSFAIASSSSSSGPVLRRLEIQCEGRDWWQPPVCHTSTNLNSTNYTISIALYSWHAGYISWLFGGLIPVNSLSHRFEIHCCEELPNVVDHFPGGMGMWSQVLPVQLMFFFATQVCFQQIK